VGEGGESAGEIWYNLLKNEEQLAGSWRFRRSVRLPMMTCSPIQKHIAAGLTGLCGRLV